MKLIISIISKDDEKELVEAMMRGGYSITKISSDGGFLRKKTLTMFSAVQNERVENALEVIKNSTHSRKYSVREMTPESMNVAMPTIERSAEMLVGGATVFVLNIEESYKF